MDRRRRVVELLNAIYRASEKAHPLLPDTFEELVEFSRKHDRVGTYLDDDTHTGVMLYLYYIPDEKLEEVLKKELKRLKLTRRSVSFDLFDYAPTSNKELFEKWKKRLEGCESVECLVERIKKYAVNPSERD